MSGASSTTSISPPRRRSPPRRSSASAGSSISSARSTAWRPTPAGRSAKPAARPVIDELAAFLDGSLPKLSGKSELAGAIRYARWRWEALTRYLDDGRLEISNNAAERAIRPHCDDRFILHLLVKYL